MLVLLVTAQAHVATHAVSADARAALLQNSWLDLQRNVAVHAREVAQSASLGYERVRALPAPPWTPPTARPYFVDPAATGMGPVCPFALAAASQNTAADGLPLDLPLHNRCMSIRDYDSYYHQLTDGLTD